MDIVIAASSWSGVRIEGPAVKVEKRPMCCWCWISQVGRGRETRRGWQEAQDSPKRGGWEAGAPATPAHGTRVGHLHPCSACSASTSLPCIPIKGRPDGCTEGISIDRHHETPVEQRAITSTDNEAVPEPPARENGFPSTQEVKGQPAAYSLTRSASRLFSDQNETS